MLSSDIPVHASCLQYQLLSQHYPWLCTRANHDIRSSSATRTFFSNRSGMASPKGGQSPNVNKNNLPSFQSAPRDEETFLPKLFRIKPGLFTFYIRDKLAFFLKKIASIATTLLQFSSESLAAYPVLIFRHVPYFCLLSS